MGDDITRLRRFQERLLKVSQEELTEWADSLLSQASATLLEGLGGLEGLDRLVGSMSTSMRGAQLDPYRVLGLDRSASDEEVKQRYRDLLRKLHPDTAGVQGTEFLLQTVMMAMEMIKRERGW